MDLLTRMDATFARVVGARPGTVADVPVCGCRELVAKDCARRLCVCCCGLACDEQHRQREDM